MLKCWRWINQINVWNQKIFIFWPRSPPAWELWDWLWVHAVSLGRSPSSPLSLVLPSQSHYYFNFYSYQCDFQGPLFTVAADAMELGLGVHGEAGVASMPLSNARFFLNCSSIAFSWFHNHDDFAKKGESTYFFKGTQWRRSWPTWPTPPLRQHSAFLPLERDLLWLSTTSVEPASWRSW